MENSSVILDNTKKQDRVRYGSVKESGFIRWYTSP